MVLENLFPENWLEKKLRYSFILAVVYSTVGIIIARLLFGANSGIVAVIFTSLLLLPYMRKLFKKEEIAELREKGGFKIKRFFIDNWPAIKVYFTIFIGVYVVFLLYTFILPFFGVDVGIIFKEQLALEGGVKGGAFMTGAFIDILINNWWVLLASFFLALFTGDGALFFVTWNASTWGVIFGYRALMASVHNPFINLLLIFFITLPHLLLEGGAYIFAAIAGSVISDDVISENDSSLFLVLLIIVVAVLGIFFWLFNNVSPLLRLFVYVILFFVTFRSLSFSFKNKKHKAIYNYNLYLFLFALFLFLCGAIIETLVLSNSHILSSIYASASGYI